MFATRGYVGVDVRGVPDERVPETLEALRRWSVEAGLGGVVELDSTQPGEISGVSSQPERYRDVEAWIDACQASLESTLRRLGYQLSANFRESSRVYARVAFTASKDWLSPREDHGHAVRSLLSEPLTLDDAIAKLTSSRTLDHVDIAFAVAAGEVGLDALEASAAPLFIEEEQAVLLARLATVRSRLRASGSVEP